MRMGGRQRQCGNTTHESGPAYGKVFVSFVLWIGIFGILELLRVVADGHLVLGDEHLVQLVPRIHAVLSSRGVEGAGGGHVRVRDFVLNVELKLARGQSSFLHPGRGRGRRGDRRGGRSDVDGVVQGSSLRTVCVGGDDSRISRDSSRRDGLTGRDFGRRMNATVRANWS